MTAKRARHLTYKGWIPPLLRDDGPEGTQWIRLDASDEAEWDRDYDVRLSVDQARQLAAQLSLRVTQAEDAEKAGK